MADYSDLDRQIEQLKRCEIIRVSEVKALCAKAREILLEEANVQRVDSPVTVSCMLLIAFGLNFQLIISRFHVSILGVWRYSWTIL